MFFLCYLNSGSFCLCQHPWISVLGMFLCSSFPLSDLFNLGVNMFAWCSTGGEEADQLTIFTPTAGAGPSASPSHHRHHCPAAHFLLHHQEK